MATLLAVYGSLDLVRRKIVWITGCSCYPVEDMFAAFRVGRLGHPVVEDLLAAYAMKRQLRSRNVKCQPELIDQLVGVVENRRFDTIHDPVDTS